jgi:DNA-binding transcriptional regulator GbsR (MarR family)
MVSEFHTLRRQFTQFMEQLVEQRGFKSMHGRILTCLMLSNTPQSQYNIAQWTKYSISTVSRALDQMVRLGSIRRFKQPGIRSYVYEIGTTTAALIIGALESWLLMVEKAREPIASMAKTAKKIDVLKLKDKEASESQRLTQLLSEMETTLENAKPIFEETVQKLMILSKKWLNK